MPEGPTKDSASKASNHEVIIAGGMAGLVSRFCISPLDVIKIRLQLQPHSYRDVIRLGSTKTVVEGPIYRGFFPTLRTIVVQEGVTALWKGNIPAECLYVTYSATQFFAYRQSHLLLAQLTTHHPALHIPDALSSSISGAIAGGIATTITYPFDLLRTRFAAAGPSQKVYTSLLQSVKEIYISEGPTGYFRGLTAGIAQIIPYMGLFFGCYETIRTSFRRCSLSPDNLIHKYGNIAGWEDATAGVMAGVLAKTGVFPLDTVRKRLQVQGPTRGRYVHKNIPVYTGGVVKSMKDILRVEGLRGLYKGLTVGLIKAAPASAVTMWTYERTMVVLRWWEDKED